MLRRPPGPTRTYTLVPYRTLFRSGSICYPLQGALATWLAEVSGVPGGIFAPSLAAGAGLGADLARFIDFAPPAAVILLTMAAYFAGATQAPLTAAVIVAEMTLGQKMTLPLMGAALPIGQASCRARVGQYVMLSVVAGPLNKTKNNTLKRRN